LILENLAKVVRKMRVWLRIPLIPGYNDSKDHLKNVGEFASALGVEKISVLPYHCWGESKYDNLGRIYSAKGVILPSEEDMEKHKEYLRGVGIDVSIGR
jgi:pyruvate formate lyase activating enzyme